MTLDAFPLRWPVGWARTHRDDRRESRYQVTFARARDELLRSVYQLGAEDQDVVISSNIALRRDGRPYANQAEPTDPGIAVYWTQDRQPRVMACDCWRTTRDNLRAVGLTIDALRAIDRSGATQLLERAFTGFAALPATTGDTCAPHWRDVLGLNGGPLTQRDVLAAFKARLQFCHPDSGGSHDLMVELNRARDEALRELGVYSEKEVR
jgi:hypothetical protein